MVVIRRAVIFLFAFFLLHEQVYAECKYCKQESCECKSLFNKILCNLRGDMQENEQPLSAQKKHTLSGGIQLAGSGLHLSGGGIRGVSPFQAGGTLASGGVGGVSPFQAGGTLASGGREINLASLFVGTMSLCQEASEAQFSAKIKTCQKTLARANLFINLIEFMNNDNDKDINYPKNWLTLMSELSASHPDPDEAINGWLQLTDTWFFIIVSTSTDGSIIFSILEWNNSASSFSMTEYSSIEQVVGFLGPKLHGLELSSLGYFRAKKYKN